MGVKESVSTHVIMHVRIKQGIMGVQPCKEAAYFTVRVKMIQNTGLFIKESDERRQSCCFCCGFVKVCLLSPVFPQSICHRGWYFFCRNQPILAKAYTVFHSLKLMKGLPLQGVCIYPHSPSTLLSCSSSPQTDFFFFPHAAKRG